MQMPISSLVGLKADELPASRTPAPLAATSGRLHSSSTGQMMLEGEQSGSHQGSEALPQSHSLSSLQTASQAAGTPDGQPLHLVMSGINRVQCMICALRVCMSRQQWLVML